MSKTRTLPQFPGLPPPRTAPAPPKYLVICDADGKEQRVEVAPGKKDVEPVKLKKPDGTLTATRYTSYDCEPKKNYSQPPHHFKRRVDSKYESKDGKEVLVQEGNNASHPVVAHAAGGGGGGGGPPKYVGTTFAHLPNAPTRGYFPRPKAPAIPRSYIPPTSDRFVNGPLLHNRTAAGKILGTATTVRVVNAENVPHYEPEQPMGPDNPMKVLDETWTAYWDDEAGAVYYYNVHTGEATWIPPY